MVGFLAGPFGGLLRPVGLLLGAVEQGLGACFVGSYNPEEVVKIFALPDHVRPVGLITVGYPAEQPRKPGTAKIPLSKLVHREKW